MTTAARPVRLIQVPYDSGHRAARMGAGPLALAGAGAAPRLRRRGHDVEERLVEASPSWRAEIGTAFELQRLVAGEAAGARGAGQLPILLSGNCNTTVGMLAAPAPQARVGVVWFDAHGDFNTPGTDASGFLDGHGLAMVTGRCWTALTASVPGFRPVPDHRVMLVGARSFDDGEQEALRSSSITRLTVAHARDATVVRQAVEALATHVDVVHLHVDLDVHDPGIAPANGYAAPDGMSAAEALRVVGVLTDRIPLASATLASYDPAYDPDQRMAEVALELLTELAAARSGW
ncbi:arginase family protein [Actinoplanes sp. NPDC051494]|uniref:arginase family protein n=1 Tax=Actinoplanes sp. NPDC051494 TaxID=3363907 RepID=UPI0037917E41